MALMAVLPACGKKEAVSATPEGVIGEFRFTETENVSDFVKIEMADGGIILMELYPDIAPITVNNFQNLVSDHFYDGIIFHRVIYGFMIQGGDPEGTGMGGSKNPIVGEFKANGFNNPIKHTRGVISMARTNDPNSASSQFFIMHADYPYLDGKYAAFGKVVSGMEIVDEIANVPTYSERPRFAMRMKRVYVK
jgi:peptidyl-prolyl cis-trans isomerase B (cyclophilin B)